MEQGALTLIGMLDKHVPVLATILGVLIGSFSTLIITFITKRSDERKHLQSLAFNAGIEEFKLALQRAKELSEKGQKRLVPPSAVYILGSMSTAKLMQLADLTDEKQLLEIYKKQKKVIDTLTDWILDEHRKNKINKKDIQMKSAQNN